MARGASSDHLRNYQWPGTRQIGDGSFQTHKNSTASNDTPTGLLRTRENQRAHACSLLRMESLLKLCDHFAHARRHRAIWIEPQVLLIFMKRALRVAFAKKDVSEKGMRTSHVRHAGHRLARVGGGLLPATQLPIGLGELVVAGRSIGLPLEPPE